MSPEHREFYDFGRDSGLLDARQGMHDYRAEFAKDPLLAFAYMGYQVRPDGTQDPRSMVLPDRLLKKAAEAEKDALMRAFIAGYAGGYGSAARN
jgi:hypothetical protein